MEIKNKSNLISLNDLHNILIEEGYTIFGHGTGGKNIEAVSSIFEKGLRTSHNSLFYTTIRLAVDNELNKFKNKLDNWPHLDSENIILIKLPNDYFNKFGDCSDINCQQTRAFVYEVYEGHKTYYLNPKFIIGSYNRNISMVTMNPKFERNYSEKTINEMKQKLKEALEETKQKNLGFSRMVEGMAELDQTISSPDDILNDLSNNDQLSMDTTFDDIDWDDWEKMEFSPLEESDSSIKK